MKFTPRRPETLQQLKKLYEFHREFLKGYKMACAPGCSTCCTVNVIATSLELEYILEAQGARQLLKEGTRRMDQAKTGYFTPQLTINEEAGHYLKGRVPPEEPGVHANAQCPLLDSDDLCTIYDRRPFACRAMVSGLPCSQGGQADMDPFIVTINLAIQQIIEHMDRGGTYGNLWDLVKHHVVGEPVRGHILECKALPGILIQPHEERRFNAFLRRLKASTGLTLNSP